MKQHPDRAYVGVGYRDITPPIGTMLAGYFEPHQALEIAQNLTATALYLEDMRGTRVALVSADVLVVDSAFTELTRAKLQKLLNIPHENILICATHTHTGPVTSPIFTAEPETGYLLWFQDQIVDAVSEAASRAYPCRFRLRKTRVRDINCNRRLVFPNGKVHTHVTPDCLPKVTGKEGPVDNELLVLAASSDDGQIRAILVNFALHPTNVRGDRIHPDYPGALRDSLNEHAGDCVTVFLNGACGNLDSKTPALENLVYGPERASFIGSTIAQIARDALNDSANGLMMSFRLQTISRMIKAPIRKPTQAQLELARQVLSGEIPTDRLALTKDSKRPSPIKELAYAREWVELDKKYASKFTVPLEISVFQIAELCIVGVPLELFCEYGLQIKAEGNKAFRGTMIAELANGYLGYMPTVTSFEHGGYETRLARSSFLAPEAGPLITKTSIDLIRALAKKRETA